MPEYISGRERKLNVGIVSYSEEKAALSVVGNSNFTGIITATSFSKSGGTSSQFLKADGSVDSSTYLTSFTETDTLDSVTGRGNSTSNGLSVGVATALDFVGGGSNLRNLSGTHLVSYASASDISNSALSISGISTYSEVGILTGSYASDISDQFGFDVDCSADGKTIVVGAQADEIGAINNTGVVYVFDREGNKFNEVGVLTGSHASDQDDRFGYSVAINADGKTIVVGAYGDEIGENTSTGIVYVFDREGNKFNVVGILTGSLASDTNDLFGLPVAVSADGKTILASAYGDEIGENTSTGIVYVFDREGNDFNQVGILTGSLASDSSDNFGNSLTCSADGKSIIVGAWNDEIGENTSTGIVYVFDREGNNFSEVGILTGSYATNSSDRFGKSVTTSADGKTIVVSAINDEIGSTNTTGVVYVFDREGNNFNEVGILTGSYATESSDNFGFDVDCSSDGKTIVVGAYGDEIGSAGATGIVYVYKREGNNFNEVGILTGSYASDGSDSFGYSVATSADGKNIIVGARSDEVVNAGHEGVVYVFDEKRETYLFSDTNGNIGISSESPTSKLDIVGDVSVSGVITATSFLKSGGTSSQFLKADGSVDSSTYLTSSGDGSGLSGVLSDVVEDTTPQLGGNLDLNSKDITGTGNIDITGNLNVSGVSTFQNKAHFLDNDRLHFGGAAGDSGDLQIYHDGSNSKIRDQGTGSLILEGNIIEINNPFNGDNMAKFTFSDAAVLYYDGLQKLTTSSSGVTVTGTLTADSFVGDITGDVTGNSDTATTATNAQGLTGSPDITITNVTGVAATFSGNVTIGGTLSYQDVENIDSIGIITAQQGIQVLANGLDITGFSTFKTGVSVTGVVTATTFKGSLSTNNLEGTITNSQLDGSIANDKLANSSIAIGGITFNLGDTDATPAFDLSDATSYPYTSLTGVTTEVSADTTPQLGGNLDLNSKDITGTGNVNVTGIITATALAGFDYLQAPHGSTVNYSVTVASKTSAHRYNGTGSGNGYVINGVESPFLTLTPGRTYRFTLSSSDMSSHPFRFYLEADKTTAYTTNVTSTATYTEIVVTDETPIVLHYQCSAHEYMGNAVQVNSNKVDTPYQIDGLKGANITGVVTATSFVGDVTGNVTGNADTSTTATNVTVSANNSTDETVYPIFVDGATGTQGAETDTGLNYNPSTGNLTSTLFTGNVTGNVTGDVTGNADTATTSTNFTVTANNSTDETVYPVFVDGATGTQGAESDTGLTYNPSSGTLTATTFSGSGSSLTGLTGASADTYGDSGATPVIVVDSNGRITGISTAAISGGGGGGGGASEAFKTIAVSGQSNVVADNASDTLTFVAGNGITITTDATADSVSIASSTITRTVTRVVATDAQTAFTVASYDSSFIDVYLNGVKLDSTEYATTNSTTITLTTGASTGDIFESVSYSNFNGVSVDSATTATNVTVTANNSTDETVYPVFVDGATGTQGVETDTGLNYNPSTGNLTSTLFTGNVTGNVTGDVTGNADTATTATNVTVSANNSTDETVYPIFVDGATGTQGAETDTGLNYNPSTGNLTSTLFTGNLTGNVTGNADTATTATTATNVTVTANNSTDETVYPIFVDGATGTQGAETDTGLSYNPNSGTLTATTFSGSGSNLTGLTGASADTYGDSGATPVITVDANGRITGISTVATAGAGGGGGISNVVEDTTPQLGGNLDLNSKFITGSGGVSVSGVVTSTSFVGDITGDVTGNADTATTATNVTVSANNSTDETVYPVFVDGATGTQGAETDTDLTYNPSSGTLTATTFSGTSGNITGSFTCGISGGVGIGTTNPQQKLHILANGNPVILLEDGSGTDQTFTRYKSSAGDWTTGVDHQDDAFIINQSADLRVGTAAFYISSTNNVGLSTESPTSKLDVNGDAEISGIVTATSFSGSGSNLTGLTGASAATYGDASNVAAITVDANGRITGISEVTISGGGGGGGGADINEVMLFG